MADEQTSQIADLEAEIKLRGDKITVLDGQYSEATKSLARESELRQLAESALAKAQDNLVALQSLIATSQAENGDLNTRIQRLLVLHNRSGQLLSSLYKSVHDEMDFRNGVNISTGE